MDASSWRRVRDLIAEVQTAQPDDRRAFLAARCGDPNLVDEIEALLEHETSDSLSVLLSTDRPPAPVLAPGVRIGRYVVVKRIGGGGMGEVFLATDLDLEQDVALKCLTNVPSGREQRALLLNEARAAARIKHDNVARVHEVVEQDGRAFMAMEYIDGESLAARIHRGPLPPAETVAVGRQLAAALGEAHARGIVHRDLKPANVQVTPSGRVKVLDFGIAQAIAIASTRSGSGSTATGPIVGTPAYMSPEQLLGARVDERSDIFSLGVVLYEMATGKRPFGRHQAGETAGATAVPAHKVNPQVPRALSAVIARAMHHDPDQRFASAADVDRALARVHTGGRRRRMWATAAAAAAIVAVAIGLAIRSRSGGPPRPRAAPVVAVLPLVSSPEDEPMSAGLGDVLAAEISTMPGVVAVPRAATIKYAGTGQKLDAIARELGIEYAITGRVDRDGGIRRVTLNLVDARRDAVNATNRFDDRGEMLFAMEQQIADWTTRQLAQLTGQSPPRPSPSPTADRAAFEEYAQARRFLDRRDVTGNLDDAIGLLTKAVSRDPHFALAHAGLGEALWAKYETTRDPALAQRAKDATLEALRLDPRQPMVRLALAKIYGGTGRLPQAIEELQHGIAQQPASDELHRALGRAYGDAGDVDKAATEFMQAIRLRPGFWETYRQLGLVFFLAGRYPDAIAALTRVTELQPDSAVGFSMLGTAYHASGDLPRALENYERANALTPSPTAWSNIGTIHYHDGRFGAAAAAYRQSIALQPKEPSTYRNLADALTKARDSAGARHAYHRAIEVADARLTIEHDADLLALKALCLAKLGQFAQADETIGQAMRTNPTASVVYHEALVRTLERRTADALNSLRTAVQKGYSAAFAREDDELIPLRTSPEFQRIVGEHSKEEGS